MTGSCWAGAAHDGISKTMWIVGPYRLHFIEGVPGMKLLEDFDAYAFRKGWPRWACFVVPMVYPSSWPIIVYRFGSWAVNIKHKWMRVPLLALWFPFKRLVEILTSIDISERATIGEGLYIAHIGNIVIVHDAIIGLNASVHQGVTIGGGGAGGIPDFG